MSQLSQNPAAAQHLTQRNTSVLTSGCKTLDFWPWLPLWLNLLLPSLLLTPNQPSGPLKSGQNPSMLPIRMLNLMPRTKIPEGPRGEPPHSAHPLPSSWMSPVLSLPQYLLVPSSIWISSTARITSWHTISLLEQCLEVLRKYKLNLCNI